MAAVVKHTGDGEGQDAELRLARDRVLLGMRRIKEEFGLSYGRLADRTHYSRSSWERFLNGKQWPSRAAIQQLAEVVDEDPAELLRLWEHAEELMRRSRSAGAPAEHREATPAKSWPGSVVGRAKPVVHMAIGAVLGASVVIAVLAVISPAGGPSGEAGRPTQGKRDSGLTAQSATGRTRSPAPDHPVPGCSGESCLGREPQTMNCQWDAKTVRLLYLRGLRIQLRHSPACKAVWGRLENGAIGDGVIITDKGSRTEEATIRVDRDTYTRMLSVAEYPLTTISICGVIPKVKERECDPEQADPQP
ncbi:helix-turn-helix domain-containing protein [Streptomyces sp. NPDC127584]|uniref:helix-turn-helix domain-containing protein n=1 Tax=Streptomyces sp. NPDC127584 TaxID=3345403 RepID=UPI00363BB4DE